MSEYKVSLLNDFDDLNLQMDITIPSSGITVIFGASGSGKTTLLNHIAGFGTSKGYVLINGQSWQDSSSCLSPMERNLSYVFQDARLFDHLNVLGNLEYACKYKAGATNSQLKELIFDLKIDSLITKKVQTLSGGEKQRVSIARALLGTPEVILMDEPLASLDGESKNQMMEFFLKIKTKYRIPIIYVTHSLDEVLKLADHIGFIDNGKLSSILSIEEGILRLNDQFHLERTVLMAKVLAFDEKDYISTLELGTSRFYISQKLPLGTEVFFQIEASNISLSKIENLDSSILNIIECCVTNLNIETSYVLVSTSSPDKLVSLTAKISKRSLHSLDIKIGDKIFAQIKSINLAS